MGGGEQRKKSVGERETERQRDKEQGGYGWGGIILSPEPDILSDEALWLIKLFHLKSPSDYSHMGILVRTYMSPVNPRLIVKINDRCCFKSLF